MLGILSLSIALEECGKGKKRFPYIFFFISWTYDNLENLGISTARRFVNLNW